VPCDRRSGIHPGRRSALTSACAVALFAGLALPASGLADGTPLLEVSVDGGPSQEVGTGDLANCQNAPVDNNFDVVNDGNDAPEFVGGFNWWDLGTLLTCGSPPVLGSLQSFSFLTLFEPNRGPESGNGVITRDDLESGNNFHNPGERPLLNYSPPNVEYLRPWRGGDDSNAPDTIGPSTAPIAVSVFTGSQLNVTVTPSATQIAPGQTVTFSTTVTPALSGSLSYQWNFGDGTPNTSTSPDPTITFNDAGNWPVTVQVSDDQGDGGPGSTLVQVGTPPTGTTTGPTTGAFTTSTPTTSATTPKPPTHNRHGHAPATSTGTSTKTSAASTTTASGSQTTATTTTTRTTAATTTTATSTTSTAAGPPAAAGSGSAAPPASAPPVAPSTAPAKTTGSTTAPSTAAATTTTPAPAPHPGSRLPLVTGRLIASVDPQAPGASPLVHTIAGGTPAEGAIADDRSRSSPAAIIAGILAALALLGLGAARERRGAIAWRSLRPPWSRRS
jgi:hypothetical protein